ncbi:MAG: exodeoxyribonuclease V subunit beta [Gammaproteobacteria bacterium]|jgi:exodeoxyribonuclease V beta subunit|nr:exodeoxyribonuclease V subunit beta [Gammaproteobacteria bacterium]
MNSTDTTFNPMTMPLDHGQLIEASAGTGKTYTITNLCLRLLLGRNSPWQRPLAINETLILTFTIAATNELKHRIAKRIEEARRVFRTGDDNDDDFLRHLLETSSDSSTDLKLLTAASQLIDEASIFTIHGFCARVLGEQTFESGTLFDQEQNAERDHVLKLAVEDCYRTLIMPLQGDIRQLALTLWPNPAMLARKLSRFLFRGELQIFPAQTAEDANELVLKAREAKTLWTDGELGQSLLKSDLKKSSKQYKRLEQMTEFCTSPGIELDNELWEIYSAESLAGAVKKGGDLPIHPALELITEVRTGIKTATTNLWHQVYASVSSLMQQHKETWNKMTVDDLLTSLAAAVNRPGSSLPDSMANRWPIAMIDEFQDTDNIQNSIFSRVYQDGNNGHSLLTIGDPKQAIYSFRGADVYTYINTRRLSSRLHNLDVNWRSSPALIEATNILFQKGNVFGNDADMPFVPVKPAPIHTEMKMLVAGVECPPYQLFVIEDPDRFASVTELTERAMNYAAEQTVSLINADSQASLDGKSVSAGQIAFLVRRRADAVAAQRALTSRGVQSVYLTLESVFLQDTAADLKLILEAILEPANDQAIKAALATRLMQTTAADIDRLNHDIQAQQAVLAEFRSYREMWLEQNVAPMLNTLMERRQLAQRWLKLPNGERQITNLRHLIEILQKQSGSIKGMYQLIKWFSHEQGDAAAVSAEDRQLRLESDENLVKIVTMHAAKGLEYDIVMIPMPVFSKGNKNSADPALFHIEQEGRYIAGVELGDNSHHRSLSAREEQEEDMRLLYVAMTRAKYRCYLGLPKLNSFAGSAIRQLLDIETLKKDESLLPRVHGVFPQKLFEIIETDNIANTIFTASASPGPLTVPPAKPTVNDYWRVHSYTGVAARLTVHEPVMVTGYADDDRNEESTNIQNLLSRHSFPRGARVGVILHSLMEDLDFQTDDCSSLCDRTLRRLGLEDEWLPVLEQWVQDILKAPLGQFSLKDIGLTDRLDEMEFHFPLATSTNLVQFLAEKEYLEGASNKALLLQGQMTGLIDLLFRRDGKYYIADYKSNFLGNSLTDYNDESIAHAMQSHQYHLQYLIYTVAVHRMLKQKLPGYRYETHMGGAYYLFLRGMNQQDSRGIFFTKPDLDTVARLDELLGGING